MVVAVTIFQPLLLIGGLQKTDLPLLCHPDSFHPKAPQYAATETIPSQLQVHHIKTMAKATSTDTASSGNTSSGSYATTSSGTNSQVRFSI